VENFKNILPNGLMVIYNDKKFKKKQPIGHDTFHEKNHKCLFTGCWSRHPIPTYPTFPRAGAFIAARTKSMAPKLLAKDLVHHILLIFCVSVHGTI